jgi:UDP-N-acetylglucosamine transferase subunit ALG13
MAEFSRCITEADLVILHGGAGSVIHAIHAGKIPVVMPRLAKYGEHVDDHQVEFARALAREGKIILAEEPHKLFAAVEEALKRKPVSPALHQAPPIIDLVNNVLRDYAKTLGK